MNRIVDLFAGCGGLSLGFQNAGFEIVGAFENWDVAATCYGQNFGHPVFQTDLSDISNAVEITKSLKPDIIIGGPPCQDFSHAGKRIEAGRAGLTGSFAEIISEIRPQFFVMENVDRAPKSNAYSYARDVFRKDGYGLTEIVLDASLCGVPQKRKRFFCIGSQNQNPGFLIDYIKSHLSNRHMTLRDYFGNTLDFEFYYRHPRNYSRRAVFSIDEPAPTVRGVNRPIPQGYPGHPNDACPISEPIRALTTLERALIQTFPADYKWFGNKTEMEQMIGNAVPVKLAEFVGKALRYHIENADSKAVEYSLFSNWLCQTHDFSARTNSDMVSRLKRADSICEIKGPPGAYYVFQLEQTAEYSSLSTNVRSQLKRAVALYADFCEQR